MVTNVKCAGDKADFSFIFVSYICVFAFICNSVKPGYLKLKLNWGEGGGKQFSCYCGIGASMQTDSVCIANNNNNNKK